MPHQLLVPQVTQGLKWQDLRIAIKGCIEAVAPKANVFSDWPLKYDIGMTKKLLISTKDSNKVHAWLISINSAEPYDEKAGGYNLHWDLNVRIWGFVGYTGEHDETVQNTIEEESRAISQIIYLNQKHLGLTDTSALKKVGYLIWDDIDVHAFGSGDDIHVAQGNLSVTLSEGFSLS